MSGDGIVSNELASIAGDAVDGTLMTFAPDPRKNPAAKELVEKFRAAGFEPEAYTLYSYAALQIVAAAANKAGARRRAEGCRSHQGKRPVDDRDRRHRLRRQGRHHPSRLRACTRGRRVTTASTPTSRTQVSRLTSIAGRMPGALRRAFLFEPVASAIQSIQIALPFLFALQHFRANHGCLADFPPSGAPSCRSPRSSSPTAPKSPSASSAPPTSWASRPSRSGPRRTSWRCTASRRTRATRSGAGRIWPRTSGRSRAICRSTRSSASPSCRAPTRSIPATACCRKARNSPMPARRPASSSSARSPRRCAGSATRSRRAIWPSRSACRSCPATDPLPDDMEAVKKLAAEIGYPVMLKASWGGGGRGMRAIRAEADLAREVTEGKREAKAAFGKDEVYLEKLIERARHVEVQVLGDTHGNVVHLFERDCSIQRRNQKVVERAPAPYLSRGAARGTLRLRAEARATPPTISAPARSSSCMDADTGKFYFIEVNPRIQVEHTVTEQVTGIDIVKAQIHILDGSPIGTPESGVPAQEDIRLNGHALQCRITTEDPGAELHPGLWPHHRLSRRDRLRHPARRRHRLFRRGHHPLLRSAAGKGHRLGADAAGGDRPHGPRAARVPHPRRRDQPDLPRSDHHPPELPRQQLHDALHRHDAGTVRAGQAPGPRDQAAELSRRRHRQRPSGDARPAEPQAGCGARRSCPISTARCPDGTKQLLDALGPEKFAAWMRDAEAGAGHRHDDARRPPVAAGDAHAHPRHRRASPAPMRARCRSCSRSNAGAARPSTSPCASSPRTRGSGCRWCARRAPNLLLQMLLRGANGVGYTNYPDNVVQHFVRQAAARRHRPVPRLRLPELGREHARRRWTRWSRRASSARRRSATPATSSIPTRAKYDLKYYVGARQGTGKGRRAHHRRQGHGGPAEAGRGARAVQGAARGDRPADPFPHARHVRHCRRRRCWRRSRAASTRSTRRWMRSPATPRSPASARSSRR